MLSKTNRQEWHESILSHCLTNEWTQPQFLPNIKIERIRELHDANCLEQSENNYNKSFRVTERGIRYYESLRSEKLFNLS